ncbi:MAG: hypothetical protein R3Y56_07830 [Akkermansia sp.]
MPRHFFTSCLAFALISPAFADVDVWAQAREHIEQRQSPKAVELLQSLDDSPEKNFWLGRALIEQDRINAAASYLRKVPEESELYPAAAKALIYCAWTSPELDFIEIVDSLSQSQHADIATLATAALLEEQLYHNQLPQGAPELLEELVKEDTLGKIRRAAPLFQIDILRLQGKYEEAIELGRQLENNMDLPSITRHRAKISLAQVYYSQAEQIERAQTAHQLSAEQEEKSEQHAEDLRGQGEETLIQFISANPDSPVLPEFFHELFRRHAFEQTDYILPALKMWTEPNELIHTKRAAISLRCLYYLSSKEKQVTSSLINSALASCPREEATHDLLLSTIRDALNCGQLGLAEQYLKLVEKKSCYEQFLQAQLLTLKGDYASALPLLIQCSETSEGPLHEASLCNAFICALHLNDHALAINLLDQSNSHDNKARMLSNRAAFYMKSRPAQSRADAQLICNQYATSPDAINAQLDMIAIILPDSLHQAIDRLRRIDTTDMDNWQHDVISRYFAMRIKLAVEAQESKLENTLSPIKVIEQALQSCRVAEVRPDLVFQYSYYLALDERYEEAAQALISFAHETDVPELKAQSMLRAGIAEEQLNTIHSLHRAIQCYRECATINSPHQTMALLRAASLLTRLGMSDEARSTLNSLEKKQSELSATEQCLLFSELADAWACIAPDESESQAQALTYCEKMSQLEHLPQAWRNRAHLQHAVLAARFGQGEEAIKHYKVVLNYAQQIHRINLRGDWYIFNSAATGAIIELSKLKQFEEAMTIADTMANRVGNPLKEVFTKFSSYIRKAEIILASPSP